MTSPSAAHTGHVGPLNEIVAASEALGLYDLTPADRDLLAEPTVAELAAYAQALVDAGHATWCPTCAGTGTVPVPFTTRTTTCTRCRGGRLNPFHGCTFHSNDPCTCTTQCQVYQPQETPTP